MNYELKIDLSVLLKHDEVNEIVQFEIFNLKL